MVDKADANRLEIEVDDDFLLDDIEDLPGFVVFPTGGYTVELKEGIEEKEFEDKKSGLTKKFYGVNMTLLEVLEVNPSALDDGEALPKEGDVCSMLFDRGHRFGMGAFKDMFRKTAEQFGCKTAGELKANSKGLKLVIAAKRRYNKEADRHNLTVVNAQPL